MDLPLCEVQMDASESMLQKSDLMRTHLLLSERNIYEYMYVLLCAFICMKFETV